MYYKFNNLANQFETKDPDTMYGGTFNGQYVWYRGQQ